MDSKYIVFGIYTKLIPTLKNGINIYKEKNVPAFFIDDNNNLVLYESNNRIRCIYNRDKYKLFAYSTSSGVPGVLDYTQYFLLDTENNILNNAGKCGEKCKSINSYKTDIDLLLHGWTQESIDKHNEDYIKGIKPLK